VAKLKLFALWPLLGLLAVPAAQAQVTLDVAKITCEQLLQNKVAAPRILGAWLSGYYNGKRNNTVLNT
jgi:hypothetical protein